MKALSQVSIDTKVMEKNIAYPNRSRLYEKARAKLRCFWPGGPGITLRQNMAP